MKYLIIATWAALIAGCPGERTPQREGAVAGPVRVVADEVPPITLRDHVRPLGYELEVAIDPDRDRFNGRVAIEVEIAATVPVIWLNAERLAIDAARVDGVAVAGVRKPEAGLIGLALQRPVGPGKARIEIEYHGSYGADTGVFRQRHEGGRYVYTDFEPIDARLAFPGFDQPRFKTPWQVSLVIAPGLEGFGNAPLAERTELDDGRVRLRFEPTPPLPSYLVAFAVGPFEIVEGPAAPVPIRVIAPRGLAGRAGPALEAAAALMPLAVAYLDREVPFRKLDFIAVPRFDGAMENPGLITVAEPILLPEAPVSIPSYRFLTMVIAHEIAHLWFGDLVTPASFEELWLNEGFATWMADRLLATWKPDWAIAGDQVDAKYEAMLLDAPPRTARQAATTRDELVALFDAIVYKKGGAIVHMIEGVVGDERFRAAVREYLDTHAHGVVTTDDVTAAIARSAGLDLASLATGFLDRGGVPVVDVEVVCGGGRATLLLSQTPYEPAEGSGPAATWPLPVCVRFPGGDHCSVLDEQSAIVALDTERCPAWLVPNAGERGYYLYDTTDEGWRALAASGALTDAERAGVVHDLAALLAAGRIELPVVLEVLAGLAPRGGRHALEAAFDLLARIHDQLLPAASEAAFAAWAGPLYRDRGKALGFAASPDDTDDDRLLRPRVLEFLGRYAGDRWTIETARDLARRWLAGEDAIAPGLMTTTLAIAATHADRAFLGRMLDALTGAGPDRATRVAVITAALGAVRDPALVDWLVSLDEQRLSGIPRMRVLGGMMAHPRNRARILALIDDPSLATTLMTVAVLDLCSTTELDRSAEGLDRMIAGEGRRRRVLREVGAQVRRCQALRERSGQAAQDAFAP